MKKQKKKGSLLLTVILIAVFAVGVGIFLYPFLSDWWNRQQQTKEISRYEETAAAFSKAECERILNEAEEYNKRLALNSGRFRLSEEELEEYNQTLDVTGTGIMGSVEIPSLDIRLPIYHGTNDEVLQNAVGHLEGTSLPVGGTGTHAAISAHRGLPTARLFTDIDQMKEGDLFFIKVLDRTLAYEVDQIRVVLPDEMQDLAIDPQEDYCTLITCTPYGVNTHRLLVRGVRTAASELMFEGETFRPDPVLMIPLIAAPVLLVVLVVILVRMGKRPKTEK